MGSRRVWIIDSAHITTDSTTAASSPLLMTFEEAGDLSVNVKDLISAIQKQEFVEKNPVCCDVYQTEKVEQNIGTLK
ncbi:hypothetical protein LEMLEM_LOCUS17687, partial [Lemmus lemmus]